MHRCGYELAGDFRCVRPGCLSLEYRSHVRQCFHGSIYTPVEVLDLSSTHSTSTMISLIFILMPLLSLAFAAPQVPNCFPAIGFNMPATPLSTTDNWWCDMNTEYAFVGFSYEVTACTSASLAVKCVLLTVLAGQDFNQLQTEFTDIRQTFNGRYVRLYGACDREGF